MNIRRIGTIFVIFGLVLICSALSLLFYNSYQEEKSYKETENVLSALESETQKSTQDDSSDEITVDVNGYDYIGFIEIPKIKIKLQVLEDVGIGYIKLGQSATTLSGGEAGRVKLAKELQKKPTGKSLFILDEPTTGLHTHDIKKLLEILNRIVDNGDTVLVIEHNLDVIKVADHIIDLGPEGGSGGGTIVATGTPEEIVKVNESYTGEFLKGMLK